MANSDKDILIERKHWGSDYFIIYDSKGKEIGITGDGRLWNNFMMEDYNKRSAIMRKLYDTSNYEELYKATNAKEFGFSNEDIKEIKSLLNLWEHYRIESKKLGHI
jgi:hypothetical protein